MLGGLGVAEAEVTAVDQVRVSASIFHQHHLHLVMPAVVEEEEEMVDTPAIVILPLVLMILLSLTFFL